MTKPEAIEFVKRLKAECVQAAEFPRAVQFRELELLLEQPNDADADAATRLNIIGYAVKLIGDFASAKDMSSYGKWIKILAVVADTEHTLNTIPQEIP